MRHLAALLLLVAALVPRPAHAETLVADLSRHLIAIAADFDGTDVLLFGTAPAGNEVVVVVHGPPETAIVRRKSRTLGIWLNTTSVRFPETPSFYAVAATAPLTAVLDDAVRARHRIGVDRLALAPEAALEPAMAETFRAGLVRNKQRLGLFPREPARIRVVGGSLFRTSIRFPANVRPGRYRVEVFGVADGGIVAAQQSALIITKVGLEARLSEFAQRDAPLYGLGAIVFAVTAGWLAATAFRRS